jgi:hypothetical protein
LPAVDGQFTIKPLLDALRSECGDAQFGYRMQGLFAHVLAKLGAVILEVNAQGHPDIKARTADTLLLVQVKSSKHSGPLSFQLSSADIAGIPSGERTKGYLAFLDCAEPVSWILLEASVARQFLNRCMPIPALRAARDEQMSQDCTEVFVEMVLSAKNRLSLLTFPLLAKRALDGEPA